MTGRAAHVARAVAELKELLERRDKLRDFIKTPAFIDLQFHEKSLLNEQEIHMTAYANVLADRVALMTA